MASTNNSTAVPPVLTTELPNGFHAERITDKCVVAKRGSYIVQCTSMKAARLCAETTDICPGCDDVILPDEGGLNDEGYCEGCAMMKAAQERKVLADAWAESESE